MKTQELKKAYQEEIQYVSFKEDRHATVVYVQHLESEVDRLSRKEKLSTYIYPFNSYIKKDLVHFNYDADQRKSLDREDKMIFETKTIELSKLVSFIKSNGKDLNLYPWVCMEQGTGYLSNVMDEQRYNECFTIRLGECLHSMIESDNELKLSLMKKEYQQFHERNR